MQSDCRHCTVNLCHLVAAGDAGEFSGRSMIGTLIHDHSAGLRVQQCDLAAAMVSP